jgi:acid phosphatase (class A)
MNVGRRLRLSGAAMLVLVAVWLAHDRFAPPYYLREPANSLVALLPPPAAEGSAATRAELDALLALQAGRTTATVAFARANKPLDVGQFAQVLGFTQTRSGELKEFRKLFEHVEDDIRPLVRHAKKTFARRRPFLVDPRITPCLDGVARERSYPSGHAAYAWTMGYLLADLLPEKRTAILARAAQFAEQRRVCGVHYASDIEAGRVAGAWMARRFRAAPGFEADARMAARELRAAVAQ